MPPHELKDTPHNIKCRQTMRKNYYECDGKAKASIKYYKKQYKDDPIIAYIISNETFTPYEKLKRIKTQIYLYKMRKIETDEEQTQTITEHQEQHTETPEPHL